MSKSLAAYDLATQCPSRRASMRRHTVVAVEGSNLSAVEKCGSLSVPQSRPASRQTNTPTDDSLSCTLPEMSWSRTSLQDDLFKLVSLCDYLVGELRWKDMSQSRITKWNYTNNYLIIYINYIFKPRDFAWPQSVQPCWDTSKINWEFETLSISRIFPTKVGCIHLCIFTSLHVWLHHQYLVGGRSLSLLCSLWY